MRRAWVLGLLLATGGVACDDGAGETADAGGQGSGTAGSSGGAGGAPADNDDAGPLVWSPPDAGEPFDPLDIPLPDIPDAGPDTRMCAMARDPLPAAVLPRCAASTRDCVVACATAADPDACRDACIGADTTPAETQTSYHIACPTCIYLQLFACIDAAGCHDGVAELFCCIAEKCPGSPDGCTEDKCGNELIAALTCGYYADMDCVDLTSGMAGECYAPGPDAGGGS